MLETERYFRVLQLTVLFSFFLYMLSYIVLIHIMNLLYLFNGTFLDSAVNIINIFLPVILKIIKFTASIFFAGGMIGLIMSISLCFLFEYVQDLKNNMNNSDNVT